MNKIFRIRIIIAFVSISGIFGLVYMAVIPGGKITYTKDFENESFFINKFTPVDRVNGASGGTQKIIGDPVYFSLRTPRRFDQAKLTIKYKNNSGRPLIEAGVLADKVIWRYDLKPLENRTIDQVGLAWSQTREGDLILLQKDKKFASLADFFKNLPPHDQIAVYNFQPDHEFILPGYVKNERETAVKIPLQGDYQFYTYIKNETLFFKFRIRDLNMNRDSDQAVINLYYRGKLIDAREMPDDGIISDKGQASQAKELLLEIPGLPEGAYKIEFRANNDIITDEIITRQQKLAFIDKIDLAGSGKSEFAVFTDSSFTGFMTDNPASLQNIEKDGGTIAVGKTYELYTTKNKNAVTKFILNKDDITISGNGNFSFSSGSLFRPEFVSVDDHLDVKTAGINFIIAKYETPGNEDGWQVASADFDIRNAYREQAGVFASGPSRYSFMISVPGLIVQNAEQEYLEIDEIKVELTGSSLLEYIKNKF